MKLFFKTWVSWQRTATGKNVKMYDFSAFIEIMLKTNFS